MSKQTRVSHLKARLLSKDVEGFDSLAELVLYRDALYAFIKCALCALAHGEGIEQGDNQLRSRDTQTQILTASRYRSQFSKVPPETDACFINFNMEA